MYEPPARAEATDANRPPTIEAAERKCLRDDEKSGAAVGVTSIPGELSLRMTQQTPLRCKSKNTISHQPQGKCNPDSSAGADTASHAKDLAKIANIFNDLM